MHSEIDPVAALLVSDLHLSLKPPLARSCEKNWLAVQAGYLRQLEELLPAWDTPIIAAGDIFDRWNAAPELMNWCLDHLPRLHAIPGQHDLIHHDLQSLPKTSFWTLVKANKIELIHQDYPLRLPLGSINPGLVLHGFPWSVPLKPLDLNRQKELGNDRAMHIAVVHRYLWTDKTGGYPGAPVEHKVSRTRALLAGYKAAVFGDNHTGFLIGTSTDTGTLNGISIFNHGCFIRRKQDERKHKPAVGLLHASGRISRHALDTSADEWIDPEPGEGGDVLDGADEFLAELESLGEGDDLDYHQAVRRYLDANGIKGGTRRRVLEALEPARGKS